jgi:rare lipoprotein A
MQYLKKYILLLCIVALAACSSPMLKTPAKAPPETQVKIPANQSEKPISKNGGGYYLDDGPGDHVSIDVDSIPHAVVKTEVPLSRANKPYMALGQQYVPMTSYAPYKKQGVASWYGKRYHGKKTSTGEVYDMYAMSAAHTTLPLPSYVKVTNPANGKFVIVRVNDRGPFKHDRLIDLSYAAAYQLRLVAQGSGLVEVEAIDASAEASNRATNNQATLSSVNPVPIEKTTEPTQQTQTFAMESATAPVVASKAVVASDVGSYFVQVGAFKSEKNAQLLQKRIEGLSLIESIGIGSVYNNDLYRVRLGPYSSRKDADASAAAIRKQLNISTIVSQ